MGNVDNQHGTVNDRLDRIEQRLDAISGMTAEVLALLNEFVPAARKAAQMMTGSAKDRMRALVGGKDKSHGS